MSRAFVGLLVLALAACGGPDEEEVRLRNEIQQLKAKRDALAMEIAGREQIRSVRPGQGAVAALAPADLAAAYQRVLPLEFDAGLLANEVEGTIVVEGIREATVDGNTLRFTATGRGRNIKLKVYVPPPYDKMARELIDGLQTGLDLKLRGQLASHDGGVKFLGRCEGAKLHKNAKDQYHRLICQGVNDRLLKEGHPVTLTAARNGANGWQVRGVVPTQGRLVVVLGSDAPQPNAPAPPPAPGPKPSEPMVHAPSKEDLARHCALMLNQLWLCKAQSVDMILDERAKVDAALASVAGNPAKRAAARDGISKELDRDGGGAEGERLNRCRSDVNGAPAQLPQDFVAEYQASKTCWDQPCRDRASCLRPFVAAALRTDAGRWLR
ncbi:MAG: hypothetical protein AB2A00_08425 [Myxococcota bacterium]